MHSFSPFEAIRAWAEHPSARIVPRNDRKGIENIIIRLRFNLLVAEIQGLSKVVAVITPRQIRAARALLGWSQQELADKAIVSLNALARLERAAVDPRMSTLDAVERALIKAGIEFIPAGDKGEGVRLIHPDRESGRRTPSASRRSKGRADRS